MLKLKKPTAVLAIGAVVLLPLLPWLIVVWTEGAALRQAADQAARNWMGRHPLPATTTTIALVSGMRCRAGSAATSPWAQPPASVATISPTRYAGPPARFGIRREQYPGRLPRHLLKMLGSRKK